MEIVVSRHLLSGTASFKNLTGLSTGLLIQIHILTRSPVDPFPKRATFDQTLICLTPTIRFSL